MEARQMTPFFHLLLLLYYFKINPPFSVVLSFMKLISILRPGLTKRKCTVHYHPNPSQLISRIHTRIFLGTRKGFISPESFLHIFLNLYIPPWLLKSLKVIVLLIIAIHLWVKKLNLFILIMPPSKTLPHIFIIILQADGNCLFIPNSVFWRYFFLKNYQNGQKYQSQVLINSTIFATFTFFGLCFVMQ